MLKIYHIEARRSERVVWLMEELDLPYELIFKPGDIMGSAMAIKAAHPIGAAPTVQDGDVWICESGAVLEYIIARYGEGRFGVPVDQPEFPLYLQWMHFAEGTAMDRILGELMLKPFLEIAPANTSVLSGLYIGAEQRMLNFIEQSLEKHTYFAGKTFTAADIMMFMPARSGEHRRDPNAYPRIGEWLERVRDRPAYKRMLARALPNGPPPMHGADKPNDGKAATAS